MSDIDNINEDGQYVIHYTTQRSNPARNAATTDDISYLSDPTGVMLESTNLPLNSPQTQRSSPTKLRRKISLKGFLRKKHGRGAGSPGSHSQCVDPELIPLVPIDKEEHPSRYFSYTNIHVDYDDALMITSPVNKHQESRQDDQQPSLIFADSSSSSSLHFPYVGTLPAVKMEDYTQDEEEDEVVDQDMTPYGSPSRKNTQRRIVDSNWLASPFHNIMMYYAAYGCLMVACQYLFFAAKNATLLDSIYLAIMSFLTIGVSRMDGAELWGCLYALSGIAGLSFGMGVLGNRWILNETRRVRDKHTDQRREVLRKMGLTANAVTRTTERAMTSLNLFRVVVFGAGLSLMATCIVGQYSEPVVSPFSAVYYWMLTACTMQGGSPDLVLYDSVPFKMIFALGAPFVVACMACLVQHIAARIIHDTEAYRDSLCNNAMTPTTLPDVLQQGHSDKLSRADFLELVLVASGTLDSKLIQDLQRQYATLEKQKTTSRAHVLDCLSKNKLHAAEFVTRIETLETHCGITPSHSNTLSSASSHNTMMQKTPSVRHLSGAGDSPALKGFDKFMNASVYKFADSCDDLEMGEMGKMVTDAFNGMRYFVVLASRSKIPSDMADIQPHLKPMTEPVSTIRALRLDRQFDSHCKAVNEMLGCVSWITCRAPQQLPAPFVTECIGSSDFWSNRIRKDFKGKDDDKSKAHLAFCDNMKSLLTELSKYIQEHHSTGVSFNPKGVSLAEAAIVLTDNPLKDAAAAGIRKAADKANKRSSAVGNTVKGGNTMGLMNELSGRRNQDGSSAATGLKKVSKDQQTWRKEFKGGAGQKPKAMVTAPAPKPVDKKKKKKGLPIMEYQERGTKWVIENHTKESAAQFSDNGVLTVDVADPKQQVYIFNCDECTIKVNGAKSKSVIVDSCLKVNVIFDTIISGCELVNSKKIGIQSDGVCPVFTIDKSVGVTVWLSESSASISSFTTSMSSEMNVNIPDGDDRKEMPIPEQFVHKIASGSLTSEVSDLYH